MFAGYWPICKILTQGIVRFGRSSHRYGAFSSWGVMIGYLQNSDHNTVLSEVSRHIAAERDPPLTVLVPGQSVWQPVTSRLEHCFDRPFAATPFRSLHLWVDLR